MRASKAAREYVQWASEKQREKCGIKELWVSTKCGESDTTSGCGANPTVGDAFDKLHAVESEGIRAAFAELHTIVGPATSDKEHACVASACEGRDSR